MKCSLNCLAVGQTQCNQLDKFAINTRKQNSKHTKRLHVVHKITNRLNFYFLAKLPLTTAIQLTQLISFIFHIKASLVLSNFVMICSNSPICVKTKYLVSFFEYYMETSTVFTAITLCEDHGGYLYAQDTSNIFMQAIARVE